MAVKQHIYIVDDDHEIRTLLGRYLKDQGYRVTTVENRRSLERGIADITPDLIVLDIMLPDGSGLEICRDLRAAGNNVPIILLTALKEDVDRIVGLEIGADDYLGKPFNPRELVARIKSVLRRSSGAESSSAARAYRFIGFTVDPAQRSVTEEDGRRVELTGAEFDLLKTFLDRPGRVLSRDLLLEMTQGRDRGPFDRSIDVLVSRLRRKFAERTQTDLFKTVRNGGYQFAVSVEALGVDEP